MIQLIKTCFRSLYIIYFISITYHLHISLYLYCKQIKFQLFIHFFLFHFVFSHLKIPTLNLLLNTQNPISLSTKEKPKNPTLFHEMRKSHLVKLILAVSLPTTFLIMIAIIIIFIFCRRTTTETNEVQYDVESPYEKQEFSDTGSETEEELIIFNGGEDLTICDILDAPGEVIGKSSYGTLYKATLQRSGKVRVLRFLRPLCAVNSDSKEFNGVIESLGFVRHDNLVPLLGFYVGNRGEKLMIHPFFGSSGNLSAFIKCKSLFSTLFFFSRENARKLKKIKRNKLF